MRKTINRREVLTTDGLRYESLSFIGSIEAHIKELRHINRKIAIKDINLTKQIDNLEKERVALADTYSQNENIIRQLETIFEEGENSK